jgi:hypothetical protein
VRLVSFLKKKSKIKPYFKIARVLFVLHIAIGGYVESGKQVLIRLKFS